MEASPPALGSAERRAAIAAAIACVSVVGLGISLSVPLLSLEMERMGVSGTWIGLNTATAGLASIIVVPFAPRMAARFGVLRLLLVCVGVTAASLVAFKAVHSFAWWFPIRFVFSAALGTLFVLSEFWINTAAPPERRGFVMGIYATVLGLGFAAGPAVLLATGTSGWAPYLTAAVLFLAAGLPLLAARGLSPAMEGGGGRTFLSFIVAAPVAVTAALVFGAAETGSFALLPVYALRIGYEASHAAFLVSMIALGHVAFQIPIGLLADRIDRRILLCGISIVGCGGALLLPATAGIGLLALLFFNDTATTEIYTVGLAHLGARFTGRDLAAANAAFVVLYNVGLMIGPPAAGAGMDAAPPHGFAYALSAFFAPYALLVAYRIVRTRRRS